MREAINVGAPPAPPYSHAIVAEGRFAFLAGQGPLRDGEYVPGTIEEETRLTLGNLMAVLAACGSGPEHVVRCGCWLVNLDDFAGMNAVYREFFPESPPARATVRADLVVGKVEIDCVAVVP